MIFTRVSEARAWKTRAVVSEFMGSPFKYLLKCYTTPGVRGKQGPDREKRFCRRQDLHDKEDPLKRRSKRLLAALAVAVLAAGAGTAWWAWRDSGAGRPDGPAVATVVRRDFATSVLATGAVKPQVGAEVRVGARISGKVERLHANIGDPVKKGQVIAELEKADLESKVDQRAAELRAAEARLSSARILRPLENEKAEAEVDRWTATVDLNAKLLRREEDLSKKGITSPEALDRIKEQLGVSEAQLASARKAVELAKTGFEEEVKVLSIEVERAKAALADANVQVSYATITAPIEGVIGSVSTQEGETVSAGLSAPTFVTIIALSRLQVDTFVDEVDIGKVKPGQKAIFTVDSFPALEFEGKVVAIYPKAVLQENVVNYDVVVEITTPYDGILRPEMTASVTIRLEAKENVLAVPLKAVKREGGKNVVQVFADGRSQPREVKIGWKDSQWIEVLSGLEEGESVLVDVSSSEPTPVVRN